MLPTLGPPNLLPLQRTEEGAMSRQFFYYKFLHRPEYGESRLEVEGNTEGIVTIKDIEEERVYEGLLPRGPYKKVDGEVESVSIGLCEVPALIHMLQLVQKMSEEAPKK